MSKSIINTVDFLYKRDYFNINSSKERSIFYNRLKTNKFFHQRDLKSHYGCVNAIDFSSDGNLMISGGDDRRVLLWNVLETLHASKKYPPQSMNGQHSSNIFTLAFDSKNKVIFSGGNDDNVISHDVTTGDPINLFLHERPVYGISVDPLNDNVFASACDDGRVLVFDTRETTDAMELAINSGPFHAVMFNPTESRLVATANSKEGIALYDTRKPKITLMQYGACESCMSIRFNKKGTKLLGLRRRLPPILFNTHSNEIVAQFDHPGYYNSCTMKSCCFAGDDDEYILSGSDDFVLYMWRIPNCDSYGQWVESAHQTLQGHRSIVNQVRYNDRYCIIASSGVEKIVKFWSPFSLESKTDVEDDKELSSSRRVYTHEDYIRLMLRNGENFMSHDYSTQSTNEDPRMMAFFDSLVQREIEGWSSEESSGTGAPDDSSTPYLNYVQRSPSPSSSSSSTSDNESSRRSTTTTTASPSTSTSANGSTSQSSTSTDPTIMNRLLFLTDTALENSRILDEIDEELENTARATFGESLQNITTADPEIQHNGQLEVINESTQNPIQELIASKRSRLIKLAQTTPEKRKKKYLKKLRRKLSYSSDHSSSSSSLSEDFSSASKLKYYKRKPAEKNEKNANNNEDDDINEDVIDENEASTSSGIRRRKTPETPEHKRKRKETTETPDSGIASDTKNKFLRRNFKRSKRCYRTVYSTTSSSSSDSD